MIFTVELLKIGDRKAGEKIKSDEELMELTLIQKNLGNEEVGKKNYKQAEFHYREAMYHLDTSWNEKNEEMYKLKVVVLQNMAICLINSGNNTGAIEQLNRALGIDPMAVKALYLRG